MVLAAYTANLTATLTDTSAATTISRQAYTLAYISALPCSDPSLHCSTMCSPSLAFSASESPEGPELIEAVGYIVVGGGQKGTILSPPAISSLFNL